MTVDHTIELIDNALDDWAVSNDAMRWSPEPAKVAAAGYDAEALAAFLCQLGRDLTAWQRRILDVLVQQGPALRRAVLDISAPHRRALVAIAAHMESVGVVDPLPSDPRHRALERRRCRHTGPPAPRMDGRRP